VAAERGDVLTNSMIAAVAEPSAREIFAALRQQALQRVELALTAAVPSRARFPRQQTADRLEVPISQVRRAIADLQDVAEQIDLGERPGDGE
jgi:hypothetical protein